MCHLYIYKYQTSVEVFFTLINVSDDCGLPGAVLRWGRGGTGPQMLASPPPKYFGSNSKNTYS